MNGSRRYYAKLNKSGRGRKILYGHTYMWNLKTKEQTNRTKTDSQKQTKGMVTRMEGVGDG